MAITGHRTSKEITRYTRGARQRLLAEHAFARHIEIDVSHLKEENQNETQIDPSEPEIIELLKEMVPRGGIEPPTLRFSVACSTN
jgi:hypothetical protein